MSTATAISAPDLTRARFFELLESGLSSQSDVRWLMSPDGLLGLCRDLDPDDVRRLADDPRMPSLLADLDDQTVATTAGSASGRAELIMRVAMDCDAAASDAALRRLLVPEGVGDDPDLNRLVTATLGDLATYLDGGILPNLREVRVPVAVSCHAHGDVVHLNLRDVGRSGVAVHLIEAPFQRCDLTLLTSMVEAARMTDTVRARLWVTSERTGDPLDIIRGPSGGLAMSVGMRRLHRDDAAPLDPRWVFAGTVESGGTVGSLLRRDSERHEYAAKLSAVGTRTLVYPSDDRDVVEPLVASLAVDLHHFAVGSVDQAERLIARHFRVAGEFQRAIDAQPPRRLATRPHKAAALALAAAAVVAGGFQWASGRHDAEPGRPADEPLVVVLDDGSGSVPLPSSGRWPATPASPGSDLGGPGTAGSESEPGRPGATTSFEQSKCWVYRS